MGSKQPYSQDLSLPKCLDDAHFFHMSILSRIHRNHSQELLRHEGDITLEMLGALEIIKANQPITQQQLANCLMCDRSATKRAVDNLIKRELVTVSKDEFNRKLKLLSISDLGEKARLAGVKIMQQTSNQFLECLDTNEQEQLLNICKKILMHNS